MPSLAALGTIATPMISAIAQTAPKVIPILVENQINAQNDKNTVEAEIETRRNEAMLRLNSGKRNDDSVPQTFFQLQQNHAGKRN